MGSYVILGSVVIIILGMIADANGTVKLVTVIITVKGISFIVRKIADSFNKDNGDIINFVGNCMAGVSCIGLIRNASKGVEPISRVLGKIGVFVNELGVMLDRLEVFIDKITFWS